jgi:hypothetical protein
VVVHGGCSGEINFGNHSDDKHSERFIFELSLEENRALEPCFELPTLNQVCSLLSKKVFLNIEIKVPYE